MYKMHTNVNMLSKEVCIIHSNTITVMHHTVNELMLCLTLLRSDNIMLSITLDTRLLLFIRINIIHHERTKRKKLLNC